MPRVVPSQVVEVIDAAYPRIVTKPPRDYKATHAAALRGILSVAQQVPMELLTGPADFTDFTLCISLIEGQLAHWLAAGNHLASLEFPDRFPDAVQKMREILARCSDEPLPEDVSAL